jgi:hypothetical protein
MDILFLENISRWLITFSLLLQLYSMVNNKNIKVNGYAFIIYAFGAFIMTYAYKFNDMYLSSRVKFKLFNSIVLLFIGILALQKY